MHFLGCAPGNPRSEEVRNPSQVLDLGQILGRVCPFWSYPELLRSGSFRAWAAIGRFISALLVRPLTVSQILRRQHWHMVTFFYPANMSNLDFFLSFIMYIYIRVKARSSSSFFLYLVLRRARKRAVHRFSIKVQPLLSPVYLNLWRYKIAIYTLIRFNWEERVFSAVI